MESLCAQAQGFGSSPGAALISVPFSTGQAKDPAVTSEWREGGRCSQIKTPILLIWKWMFRHHPILRGLTGGHILFPAEKNNQFQAFEIVEKQNCHPLPVSS